MKKTTFKPILFFGLFLSFSFLISAQNKQANTNEWCQLFNGKDLAGWKHAGGGSHYVEDGFIKSHGGMGILYWAEEKFSNCKIRVVFRMRDSIDNSGVFIRMPVEPREEWMPIHYGYEVQIDNHPELWDEDEFHYTGTLYSLTKPMAKVGRPGPEWNTFEITLFGPRTIVYVNDHLVTDYTEGDAVPDRVYDFEPIRGARPDSGYIGLQNHDEENVVFFKEVAVKPLTEKEKTELLKKSK